MATLIINGSKKIDGKLSVNRTLVTNDDGSQKIVVQGMLDTEVYIDEILSIDAPRFSVTGVTVMQESFGSEEDKIIYSFVAEELLIEEEG